MIFQLWLAAPPCDVCPSESPSARIILRLPTMPESLDEVQKAYRIRAREVHPDRRRKQRFDVKHDGFSKHKNKIMFFLKAEMGERFSKKHRKHRK